MKTTLDLEDDLMMKLNRMAQAAGVSVDKVLNDAVREGLPKIEQTVPVKAKPFQQTTYKMGWFPGMTWDKIQEVLLEEEASEYRCSERVK